MEAMPIPADSNRYDRAARTYNYGRLGYGPDLIRHAVDAAQLGPDSTVLDLGCGPGTIANEIARFCGQVLAVDPSPAMLDAGRADAPGNVTYLEGSSGDLSFIDRPLQLVTFGRSFHWMDREATLKALDRHVAPDGYLAFLYVAPLPDVKVNGVFRIPEHDWWRTLIRTADRISDGNKKELQPPSIGQDREEMVLARLPFSRVSFHGHIEKFEWSIERLTAWVQSRYITSAGGGEEGKSGTEIAAAIREALKPHGEGPWVTYNQHRIILARRP